MEFSWNPNRKWTETSLNLLFQRTLFLMFSIFQKYFNPQVRNNKLVYSVVYHPCPSRLASMITSFHISLNSLGFYLSPECLLNFLYLLYFAFHIFQCMVLKFLENSLNLCIFTHAPCPHSKIHLEFFENLFPTARKG